MTLAVVVCGVIAVPPVTVAAAAGGGAVAPNDALFAKQWGLGVIGAPEAWGTTTGTGIKIGVVDTGVDLTHADLAGQVVASVDCVGSGGNPLDCRSTGQDDNGHGTEVSGLLAAVAGNGIGIAGVAPGAHLLVAKAIDHSGNASIEDVNAAIEWLVGHGAQVINLSLGDPAFTFTSEFGATLRQGIEYAWTQGVVPVLGAGNGATLGLSPTYSSDLDAVVVGSSNRAGTMATGTTPTGDAKWAVMAPGGSADGVQADDIVSTTWISGQTDAYGYASGTSMAAPLVSGTVALLLAAGLSPQAALDRLLSTSVDPGACGSASPTCRGVVDAAEALGGLPTAPPAAVYSPAVAPTIAATVPPTTVVRIAPPVSAAPPAVMRPAPPAPHPATPTTTPAAAGHTPGAAPTPGPLAVNAAAPLTHHSGGTDLEWIIGLAVMFAAIVVIGVVRVMRAPVPID